MENKEKNTVVDVLQELTLFVNDGVEGYKHAAKEENHEAHKTFYSGLATQRERFSEELNQFIRSLGGTPEDGTTFKGKLYRQWMDLKAAATFKNDNAIIGSCIYGEEWAQKAFNNALEHDELPANMRTVIERQKQASLDAMRKLEEMKKG